MNDHAYSEKEEALEKPQPGNMPEMVIAPLRKKATERGRPLDAGNKLQGEKSRGKLIGK